MRHIRGYPCVLVVVFLHLSATDSMAQAWGSVEGHVRAAESTEALVGITILVDGTNFGTATDEDGWYQLRLPPGQYALRFTGVGYAAYVDSALVAPDARVTLNIALYVSTTVLGEVTVEQESVSGAGIQQVSPEVVRNMPSPFKGFQALQVLPGVVANNELSNQYSVRGGGFNENLIFLDGFEIHMPFRPRQGEQEGLGLLNPDLAQRITLYTGGFPARYGGKISSTLDIQYRKGEEMSGSAYVSLLDAGGTASASALGRRFSWVVGLRKAQARRFFSTQELKGNYQPDYFDVQAHLSYEFAAGHALEATGIWADHTFRLDPRGRKTFYGIVSARPDVPSDLRSVWIAYDDRSREEDGYGTGFVGVRMKNQLTDAVRVEHDVSMFRTRETEAFTLIGNSIIYDVITDPEAELDMLPRGNARQEDYANNFIGVTTWTGKGRYILTKTRHAAEAGWSVRHLTFEDRIDEESAIEGHSPDGDVVRVIASTLQDSIMFGEQQVGFYAQDAIAMLPEANRLVATIGLRTDYFTFNNEWTVSPRLSARYEATDRLTLTGAWGLYYQAPTYRELRGAPAPGESVLGALNHDLRSQRSMQFVAGAELFAPRRRLYLRAEAYWKQLTNLISYTLENVRVEYSGKNDATGHVYGLDLQVRGEFVPGLESWINYGYLVAREQFLPDFQAANGLGIIARPTDQRHTVAVFVQDYVPADPTWKLHMRALFGSGLPYTPPVPGRRVGSVVTQVPGDRFSARFPEFRRIDFGVTKAVTVLERAIHYPLRLELTAELLNVFDMNNIVAYSWIPDASGVWQRIPTRLTPRTINIRLRVSF